jgi:hypothetical protein
MTVDAAAAKQHLSEARDTLSQLTSMPEAAKLQGDSRTQVSSLISNFNELITTQSDWRSAYAKVDANLSALLGPESAEPAAAASGVSGAVGTSGASPALDAAIRAKLVEFRTHLKEFERSAGGNAAGAAAPSAATGSTTSPASAAPPATPPATPPAMAASSATTTTAADQAKPADNGAQADVSKHLDAISAILDQSQTGTLSKTQTAELKKHFAELRTLLIK